MNLTQPATRPVACRSYARGTHAHAIDLGDLTIYFSYKTPIAFHVCGSPPHARENVWGSSTGAHINKAVGWHDNPIMHASEESFLAALNDAIRATVNG